MTPATVRPPRAVKQPVFADFAVRDFQRRFDAADERLLRRWERITVDVLEIRS